MKDSNYKKAVADKCRNWLLIEIERNLMKINLIIIDHEQCKFEKVQLVNSSTLGQSKFSCVF